MAAKCQYVQVNTSLCNYTWIYTDCREYRSPLLVIVRGSTSHPLYKTGRAIFVYFIFFSFFLGFSNWLLTKHVDASSNARKCLRLVKGRSGRYDYRFQSLGIQHLLEGRTDGNAIGSQVLVTPVHVNLGRRSRRI